jgi:hypothetical protein
MSRTDQKEFQKPVGSSRKASTQTADARSSPSTTNTQAAGLDRERHVAAQRASHEAEILRQAVVPASMATAIRIDQISSRGYRAYLDRLLRDASNPTDPIEVMLLEQLAMTHFRIAQLHSKAGQAQGIEAEKMFSSAAARLLGEFRRTALAIRVYRAGVPDDKCEKKLKIHKLAR